MYRKKNYFDYYGHVDKQCYIDVKNQINLDDPFDDIQLKNKKKTKMVIPDSIDFDHILFSSNEE